MVNFYRKDSRCDGDDDHDHSPPHDHDHVHDRGHVHEKNYVSCDLFLYHLKFDHAQAHHNQRGFCDAYGYDRIYVCCSLNHLLWKFAWVHENYNHDDYYGGCGDGFPICLSFFRYFHQTQNYGCGDVRDVHGYGCENISRFV